MRVVHPCYFLPNGEPEIPSQYFIVYAGDVESVFPMIQKSTSAFYEFTQCNPHPQGWDELGWSPAYEAALFEIETYPNHGGLPQKVETTEISISYSSFNAGTDKGPGKTMSWNLKLGITDMDLFQTPYG